MILQDLLQPAGRLQNLLREVEGVVRERESVAPPGPCGGKVERVPGEYPLLGPFPQDPFETGGSCCCCCCCSCSPSSPSSLLKGVDSPLIAELPHSACQFQKERSPGALFLPGRCSIGPIGGGASILMRRLLLLLRLLRVLMRSWSRL